MNKSLPAVTRFELISQHGRVIGAYEIRSFAYAIQDGGQTFKVFVNTDIENPVPLGEVEQPGDADARTDVNPCLAEHVDPGHEASGIAEGVAVTNAHDDYLNHVRNMARLSGWTNDLADLYASATARKTVSELIQTGALAEIANKPNDTTTGERP